MEVVENYFPQYALQDQEVLSRKESIDKVLALVPEDILFPICIDFIHLGRKMNSKLENWV